MTRSLKSLTTFALISLAISLVGITLLIVRENLLKGNTKDIHGKKILVDTAEIGLVTYAQFGMKSPPMTRRWYRILDTVDNAIGLIGIGWGLLNLMEDISGWLRAPN